MPGYCWVTVAACHSRNHSSYHYMAPVSTLLLPSPQPAMLHAMPHNSLSSTVGKHTTLGGRINFIIICGLLACYGFTPVELYNLYHCDKNVTKLSFFTYNSVEMTWQNSGTTYLTDNSDLYKLDKVLQQFWPETRKYTCGRKCEPNTRARGNSSLS